MHLFMPSTWEEDVLQGGSEIVITLYQFAYQMLEEGGLGTRKRLRRFISACVLFAPERGF